MNGYIGLDRMKEPPADAGHVWELTALLGSTSTADPPAVIVRGNDYTYDGWLVASFYKKSGAVRFVVEDKNGRLFIHNAEQIETPKEDPC